MATGSISPARRVRLRTRVAAGIVAVTALAACSTASADEAAPTAAPTSQPPATQPPATEPGTTQPTTTQPASTQPATTEPATTAAPTTAAPTTTFPEPIEGPVVSTTSSTIAPTTTTDAVPSAPPLPALTAAAIGLADRNVATAVTVWRDGRSVFSTASGFTVGGAPATSDTPMVLASVSKLITSLTIARLIEDDRLGLGAPVPWDRMGIAHDPAWDSITVRDLLAHTSGMPKAQKSWLDDPGSCAIPLTAALSVPPTMSRGTWLYSNGNYCALGLLIEAVTGTGRDAAALDLVFDPIAVSGPHLSTDGVLADDAPYPKGVGRLERLGGAGTWLASTDDIAAMLQSVTVADLATMAYPAVMIDQYGWGHTGTVDGAKACAWVLEQGRTIVVGIVSGNRPGTGGGVCDVLIPALAADLGIWADRPNRLPV